MLSPLLDADGVAAVLGVTRQTVYNLAESNDPARRLPAVRIGRNVLRFDPDAVRAYIAAHSESAVA